jgi:hypothetical protein
MLLDSEPHVMVTSLDDTALEKSQAIAVFGVGSGKVALTAPAGLDSVEVGEVDNGHFRPVDEIKSSRQGGPLTFRIDDVQARGVLLVTSSGGKEHARALMSRAVQYARLRGAESCALEEK